ncbi:phosphotransferase family protein [Streptomyces sp. BR123]|uniref:phosphotransferase family protein n=1 Tax=Streptomyces sp. BR123 TaxID=2749828 RepID=UPI0015C43AED|nr:phosphotransferase family protein [Streptomyces sp. BR123]NXY95880.1 phosphotransferase family protein [Streptomyces sp. BR123]
MTSAPAPAGDPRGLDLERLRGHLDRARPGLLAGPLHGRLIEGGRSNLTYEIGDGSARWVVRRPPLGHVLATAHDMRREHRVIEALHGTAVPVPEPVLLCEDESVLGAPFYVMEFVDGVPYRTAGKLAALGPERTRRVVLGLVDTLVELHAVDPQEVGLGDFGRPEGFLDRQLRRWAKQLAASRGRDLAGIDELHGALGRALPRSPAPTVVHGDYRLDNVLVGGPGDTVRAVLDWEMSTLGDPLTDLGLLVMYSSDLGLGDSPVSTTSAAPGHPAPAELIARYAARSGRDTGEIAWYTAFAWFKLAVILEGIHYRWTLGQTVGEGFDRIGELVPVFIEHGLTTLQEG